MPIEQSLYSSLSYGVEMEMTGETREKAAQILAEYFERDYSHTGGVYDKYTVTDAECRVWSVMFDSSITPLRHSGNRLVAAGDEYKVEFVTPPLIGGQSIDMLQEVIRKLRRAGFVVSETCGLHIHVGIKELKTNAIIHLLNQIHSKQSLLFKALGVDSCSRRYRYCRKIPTELVENIKRKKPQTLSELADVWYDTLSFRGGRYEHYDKSRYHIVNLTRCLVPDSRFYIGTVEFRCFSGTMHAGKVRAYIQFCLLLIQYCAGISKSSYKPVEVRVGESEAYKLRCFFLKIGCIGNEFKTMRLHWLERFGKQSKAWRRGDMIN